MESDNPYAGEYAALMQKMLDENKVAADAVRASARAERAAAAEREAARAHRAEVELNREKYLAGFTENHRSRLIGHIREEVQEALIKELLRYGEDSIEGLLDVSEKYLDQIRKEEGYIKLGNGYAWMEYADEGRGGYVIFRRGKTTCNFWRDIGAGNALMVIEVHTEADWEAETGIPLAERQAVLQFIGERVIVQQAPGYLFRIDPNSIVIYR